jgi:hypothetical protein
MLHRRPYKRKISAMAIADEKHAKPARQVYWAPLEPFLVVFAAMAVLESAIYTPLGLEHGALGWLTKGLVIGLGITAYEILWNRLARSGRLPVWALAPAKSGAGFTRHPTLLRLWFRHRRSKP